MTFAPPLVVCCLLKEEQLASVWGWVEVVLQGNKVDTPFVVSRRDIGNHAAKPPTTTVWPSVPTHNPTTASF